MIVLGFGSKLLLIPTDCKSHEDVIEIYDENKPDRFYLREYVEEDNKISYLLLAVVGNTYYIKRGTENKIINDPWCVYTNNKVEQFITLFFNSSGLHLLYPDFSIIIIVVSDDQRLSIHESSVKNHLNVVKITPIHTEYANCFYVFCVDSNNNSFPCSIDFRGYSKNSGWKYYYKLKRIPFYLVKPREKYRLTTLSRKLQLYSDNLLIIDGEEMQDVVKVSSDHHLILGSNGDFKYHDVRNRTEWKTIENVHNFHVCNTNSDIYLIKDDKLFISSYDMERKLIEILPYGVTGMRFPVQSEYDLVCSRFSTTKSANKTC